MSYFVFDLDETLAELYSVYPFLATLKLQDTVAASHIRSIRRVPSWLQWELDKAYTHFVRRVWEEETSNQPLGILRPGILDLMEQIRDVKEKGIIRDVAIYSNNGHLDSLHFVRDVIHYHLGGTSLISDCIHWHHPARGEERITIPGFPTKTWPILRRILTAPPCHAPQTLQPKDVHFFDDQDHWELKRVLQANYHQIQPSYDFKASAERIAAIFKESIKEAKVSQDAIKELQEYVTILFTDEEHPVFISYNHELESITYVLKERAPGTVDPTVIPFFSDEGMVQMERVLSSLYDSYQDEHHKRRRANPKRGRRRGTSKHGAGAGAGGGVRRRRNSYKNRKRRRFA